MAIPVAIHTAAMQRHARCLMNSYQHWTGRALLPQSIGDSNLASRLFCAPFALVSHGSEEDPIFNFGNRVALDLFERSWDAFVGTPSRTSAEPACREARAALLAHVRKHGFIDDYSGIRVTASGGRFEIVSATVWNLIDEADAPVCGQAAMFNEWRWL